MKQKTILTWEEKIPYLRMCADPPAFPPEVGSSIVYVLSPETKQNSPDKLESCESFF